MESTAPKRFLNSFMLFSAEERRTVQDQLGSTKSKKVVKALAKKWRNLSDDDKKRFEDEALEGKKRWLSEKQAFQMKTGAGDNSQAAIEDIAADAPDVPENVAEEVSPLVFGEPDEASLDMEQDAPDFVWDFAAPIFVGPVPEGVPDDVSTYVWDFSVPDSVV